MDLHSSESIAIHFDTFDSAQESFDDPIDDLNAALKQHSVAAECFLVLHPGQYVSPQSLSVERSDVVYIHALGKQKDTHRRLTLQLAA